MTAARPRLTTGAWVCLACSATHPSPAPERCGCGAWHTYVPSEGGGASSRRGAPRAVRLDSAPESTERVPSGHKPIDALLNGGWLPGTVTLVHGPAGSGKSTLCYRWAAGFGETLLVCPEMAPALARGTAERSGADPGRFWLAPEHGWASEAERLNVCTVVIDSVSKLRRPVGVVAALTSWAVATGGLVLAIAHESKKGRALGPVALTHDPDCVIRVTQRDGGLARVELRKSRWGPSGRVAVPLVS